MNILVLEHKNVQVLPQEEEERLERYEEAQSGSGSKLMQQLCLCIRIIVSL